MFPSLLFSSKLLCRFFLSFFTKCGQNGEKKIDYNFRQTCKKPNGLIAYKNFFFDNFRTAFFRRLFFFVSHMFVHSWFECSCNIFCSLNLNSIGIYMQSMQYTVPNRTHCNGIYSCATWNGSQTVVALIKFCKKKDRNWTERGREIVFSFSSFAHTHTLYECGVFFSESGMITWNTLFLRCFSCFIFDFSSWIFFNHTYAVSISVRT